LGAYADAARLSLKMSFIVALALSASLPVIDSVHIESRWGGLGEPSVTTYTISRDRDGQYRRRFAAVPSDVVERFAAAITAAPLDRTAGLRTLVTPQWTKARASEPHDNVSVPRCSPEAKRLLRQWLADPDEALKTLDRYFSARWTDDYPFVSVDVTFQNGHIVRLQSDAQPALMLPWKVSNAETWNPEIPRAIVGLLPDRAEPRLTDEHLAMAYTEPHLSKTAMKGVEGSTAESP
jgi:hypothetical protein